MDDDLRERLRQAKAGARALSAMTDELNATIAEVQAMLNDLRLGVPARVEMKNGRTLAFGRCGSEWGFFIEDTDVVLLKAGRADRVAAAESLPAIVDALLAVVDEEIERTRLAKANAFALAQRIRQAMEE
jgi:hypothetical protein